MGIAKQNFDNATECTLQSLMLCNFSPNRSLIHRSHDVCVLRGLNIQVNNEDKLAKCVAMGCNSVLTDWLVAPFAMT
jgi:hypothetical protein